MTTRRDAYIQAALTGIIANNGPIQCIGTTPIGELAAQIADATIAAADASAVQSETPVDDGEKVFVVVDAEGSVTCPRTLADTRKLRDGYIARGAAYSPYRICRLVPIGEP